MTNSFKNCIRKRKKKKNSSSHIVENVRLLSEWDIIKCLILYIKQKIKLQYGKFSYMHYVKNEF